MQIDWPSFLACLAATVASADRVHLRGQGRGLRGETGGLAGALPHPGGRTTARGFQALLPRLQRSGYRGHGSDTGRSSVLGTGRHSGMGPHLHPPGARTRSWSASGALIAMAPCVATSQRCEDDHCTGARATSRSGRSPSPPSRRLVSVSPSVARGPRPEVGSPEKDGTREGRGVAGNGYEGDQPREHQCSALESQTPAVVRRNRPGAVPSVFDTRMVANRRLRPSRGESGRP